MVMGLESLVYLAGYFIAGVIRWAEVKVPSSIVTNLEIHTQLLPGDFAASLSLVEVVGTASQPWPPASRQL